MNELRNSNVYSFECEIYEPEIMCTRKKTSKILFELYQSSKKLAYVIFSCQSILIHVREGHINFQKLLQIKKSKELTKFRQDFMKNMNTTCSRTFYQFFMKRKAYLTQVLRTFISHRQKEPLIYVCNQLVEYLIDSDLNPMRTRRKQPVG